MPSTTEITVPQLSRRVGLPKGPAIVDVRVEENAAARRTRRPGRHQPPRSAFDARDVIPAEAGIHDTRPIVR
jgi:hypothetical protein